MSTPVPGTLYLIPTQLADPVNADLILPRAVSAIALGLDHYIAENAKTARAFLKAIGIARPLAEVSIRELDKHAQAESMHELLAPLLAGRDMGLVSEAGAPAVADPGALVVAAAHAMGVRVTPLVGPSSLLLGLMASGLNGQNFAFHGYLPQDKTARAKMIHELERESRQRNMTQLFIETPYRNQPLFADLLATLAPATRLCVASDLTGPGERITMQTIARWREQSEAPEKVPTLFLFLA
ncbi:MAG TPA: SAM-dependent methyltransferase [Usitatibacteraceae bacterium]